MKLKLMSFILFASTAPLLADGPPTTGYKVGEFLQPYAREYRVSGPGVEKPGESYLLVCTYSTRPTVMVYTRDLTPGVIRLIKKLDAATADHWKERMGSYIVLVCEDKARAKDLLALAEKEKIRHTLLSLVVVNKERPHERYQAKFGDDTHVILVTGKRRIMANHAYRKGMMNDDDIAGIMADLPMIFPKKE